MNYRGRFWVKKEKREIFLYLVISGGRGSLGGEARLESTHPSKSSQETAFFKKINGLEDGRFWKTAAKQ